MKRILCITICVMMILTSFSAFASTSDETSVAGLLSELNIMSGDPDGNLRLSDAVTRAEFSKIAVNASQYRNSVATNSAVSPFVDVSYMHWAAPYIKLAISNSLVTGYPDGTFKPESNVTFEEALTVVLRILGYTDEDFGVSWPYGQVGLAKNLDLNDNMYCNIGDYMSRRDVMYLIYNMLNADSKGTATDYINKLDYKIIEDGVLIATALEDSSVGSDKVFTSDGTFTIKSNSIRDYVGRRGDIIVKNNTDMVGFIPSNQIVNTYSIYQTLDDDLVVYNNGSLESLNIDTSLGVYNKSAKSTLKAMLSTISAGDVLTTYKNEQGVLDYGMISTDQLQGPYIVNTASWAERYGMTNATNVTRDGVKCTMADVSTNDVIYFSKALGTVWAYSKKVTGLYESATPNKDMPTSITVSGVTYQIEGVDAYNALSSNGSFNYGDTVTLLLGRNKNVAGVIKPEATSKSIAGYLTQTGTKEFKTTDDTTITSYYISVISSDGTTTDYKTANDYSGFVNKMVSVKIGSNGYATIGVNSSSSSSLYGTVNAQKSLIGTDAISPSVNIIDVGTNGGYAKIYMQRIDGLTLNRTAVLYYEKDDKGLISEIYLNDVTGDAYKYGIVTGGTLSNSGSVSSINIQLDGVNYTKSGFSSALGSGVAVVFKNNAISTVKGLYQIGDTITSFTESEIKTKNETYAVSPKAVAYISQNTGTTFMKASIDEVCDMDKYTINAYYDKKPSAGGQVRVIVATQKK